MCGIAGIVRFDSGSVRWPVLRAMTDALAHRGPDGEGYLLAGDDGTSQLLRSGADPPRNLAARVAIGHRRLAIIDLSPLGLQPMASADRSLWIAYNGEVYNYLELRAYLERLGRRFTTATDTEVILAAYERWGEDCVSRFNGMFAFAIWDARRRRLFLARDRLGVKPLYYYRDERAFLFASELKALLRYPELPRRLDRETAMDYLVHRLVNHSDASFIEGVRYLPAGHRMVVTLDGRVELGRWWSVPEVNRDGANRGTPDEWVSRLRDLIEDAVRLRLRSDVPVGTCLSGGLDSSCVAAIVHRLLAAGVRGPDSRQVTFSAAYEDARFDERPYIDAMIRATGAQSHLVFPAAGDLWGEVDTFFYHQDEPVASTSQYAQWAVMRLAREQGVTVLLNGQGGDELLAGYPAYQAVFLAERLRRGDVSGVVREFAALRRLGQLSAFALAGRTAYELAPATLKSLARTWIAAESPEGRTRRVLTPEAWAGYASRRMDLLESRARGSAGVQDRLYEDTFLYSLPSLLRYEDRSSMAFSRESRLPYLDYRFVEFAFTVPAQLKIRDGWTKWPLRQAFRDVLPDAVCWRRDKKGFVTPEVHWLRAGREEIRRTFSGPTVALADLGLVRPAALLGQLDASLQRPETATSTDLWRWFNLERWARRFLR